MRIFRILTPVLLVAVAGAADAQNLPVADAGDDQTIDCAMPEGADVTLDGTASSDGDGDLGAQPLAYSWTDAGGVELSTEAMPTLAFAPGTHVVKLTVDDVVDGPSADVDDGSGDDSFVTIIVNADVTPPEIVMAETSDELFPPNHKTHPYEIAEIVESVTDDCTEMTMEMVVFGHATSDELDNGIGDGNTTGDVDFRDCHEVRVRAERSGPEDGRVYVLHLHADDEAGNRASESYEIGVPHDMGNGHEAVAGAPMAEYFSACYDGAGPAACAPAENLACDDASAASLMLKAGKNPALRFHADGYAPTDGIPLVCLYEGGALVGGADSLGKVKVKGDAVSASAKGDSVMVPGLGALGTLRAEYHAGGECVAASFDDAKQNAKSYKAKNK
jgi:hypothetical protein